MIYSSRMTNSAGGVKEIYYSNGGMLDMDKQCVNSEGGMTAKAAAEMGMKQNLLGDYSLTDTVMKAETSANTGNDPMTSANMRNWMSVSAPASSRTRALRPDTAIRWRYA